MKASFLLTITVLSLFFAGCRRGDSFRVEKIYLMEKGGEEIPMVEKRDIIRILEFPTTRQAENWTCGASVVQKVCAYYGEDHREGDLVKILGSTPDDGTALQPMIGFLLKSGFKVDMKEYMTIRDLQDYVDKGIPVILMLQAWAKNKSELDGWSNGHFVVCIGYTKHELLFSDPSLYDVGYIPNSELMRRWHDLDVGNRKYYQLGIAVYGKKSKFDLERIEEIK